MKKRKIIFFGTTNFSFKLLEFLVKEPLDILAIFTTPKGFNISYSESIVNNYNYADLSKLSKKNDIPLFNIYKNENDSIRNYIDEIKILKPDIFIVAGWYYMIPEVVLKIPFEGAWALHSSLLPKYAGGAPLVWAKINGEKYTGVTLFKMKKGVDNGDIIGQERFKIEKEHTIKDMLENSFKASKKLLLEFIKKEKIHYKKQNNKELEIFPQRSPEDGKIDWTREETEIINFIKAQTKPYPGAWTIIGDYKLTIWDASIKKIKKNE